MISTNQISGKRILITGGAGFIANRLIRELLPLNEITIYDNFTRDTFSKSDLEHKSKVRVIKGDVLDLDSLTAATKDVDIFIHAAAIAGIDTVAKDSVLTMKVNMLGTANALEAAYRAGVSERFINFSTSEVFGPYSYKSKESEATVSGTAGEARWTYAVSKLAGEHLGLSYFRQHSLPVVNVRPFNVYGPGQTGEGALSIFIQKALKDNVIEIDGDGAQIRAWCYIDDFVEGLLLCIQNQGAIGESINIGNSRATMTILGLANTVCRVIGSNSKIVHLAPLSEDIALRVPSLEKARRLIGFEAKVDLEEGIQRTAEWIKEN